MSSWLISQTLTIIHSHHYSCQSKHTLHTTRRALQQIEYEHVMCNSHQKQRAGWHYYCCWHACGHSWHSWELSWVGQWWTYDTNRKQHCCTHHQQCGADHFLNNHHHHNCEQSSKASCTHHDHWGIDHLLNHHHYHWKENTLHASFQHWTSLHKLVHAVHVCMY